MSLDEKHICTFSKKEQGPKRDDTASTAAPLAAGANRGPQDLAVPVPPQHLMTLQMSMEDEKIKVLHQDAPPKGIGSWVLGPKVFVFIGLYQQFTLGVIPRVCQRLYFH